MFVYDHVCNDLSQDLRPNERIRTLDEHEKDPKCPKCGGKDLEQEVTAFYAVTVKKGEPKNWKKPGWENRAVPWAEVGRPGGLADSDGDFILGRTRA